MRVPSRAKQALPRVIRAAGAAAPNSRAMAIVGGAGSASIGDAIRGLESLDQLVRRQDVLRPDAVAISAPGRGPLTYHDLCVQVDGVIKALRAAGIGRSDRVALALPNGPDMAVAFLAVASAATAAPLDPAGRAGELDFALAGVDAKVLVVQEGSDTAATAVARARGVPVLDLVPRPESPAGVFNLVGARGTRTVAADPNPTDIALVLHTSGTTGRPKLVPLTHANVCTSSQNISLSLGLKPEDRCLNVLPLFHGHGLMSPLLATLVAGASVVCTPGFDAAAFPGWMEDFRPTWYTAVPTIHKAILGVIGRSPKKPHSSRLRFVRSASAPLPESLRTELEKTFAVPALDSYGMTEASSIITSNPLPPQRRKPGSVGVSIGCEVAVMGHREALLPAGEIGEIVVRGPTVMAGYEDDPSANSRAFARGWFRTGDEGYLDEDGFLFLTGRVKEIINRGGTKVSPAEVDAALVEHPAIADAVSFPLPHSTLGEDVAAAVVAHGEPAVSEEEIRAFVASRLADHKVPRRIFFLNEIPRGATGKVTRLGLAEKLVPSLNPEFVTPRTALEGVLADIWADVLGVERVGIEDHFFDLGGNSLLIARVQTRLQHAIGRQIPLVELFAYPTISALAGHLSEGQGSPPPLPPRERQAEQLRQGSGRLLRQLKQRRAERGT